MRFLLTRISSSIRLPAGHAGVCMIVVCNICMALQRPLRELSLDICICSIVFDWPTSTIFSTCGQ